MEKPLQFQVKKNLSPEGDEILLKLRETPHLSLAEARSKINVDMSALERQIRASSHFKPELHDGSYHTFEPVFASPTSSHVPEIQTIEQLLDYSKELESLFLHVRIDHDRLRELLAGTSKTRWLPDFYTVNWNLRYISNLATKAALEAYSPELPEAANFMKSLREDLGVTPTGLFLSYLAPQSLKGFRPHTHCSAFRGAITWGYDVQLLHFPVITSPSAVEKVFLPGHAVEQHYSAGSLWVFNSWYKHDAIHGDMEQPKIHLVAIVSPYVDQNEECYLKKIIRTAIESSKDHGNS